MKVDGSRLCLGFEPLLAIGLPGLDLLARLLDLLEHGVEGE
jgi:hypothetical protein